jgi:hypothetical protein
MGIINYINQKIKQVKQRNTLSRISKIIYKSNFNKKDIIVNDNISLVISTNFIVVNGFKLTSNWSSMIFDIKIYPMFYDISYESMEKIINKIIEELESFHDADEMYTSYEKTIRQINKK